MISLSLSYLDVLSSFGKWFQYLKLCLLCLLAYIKDSVLSMSETGKIHRILTFEKFCKKKIHTFPINRIHV